MHETPTIALVTGGASGIGRLHTLRLAARGIAVAVLDLHEAGLKSITDEAPGSRGFRCDVTDLAALQQVVAEITRSMGPIGQVYHCAAIMPGGKLAQQATADITRVMQINYFGLVHVVKTVLPAMLERNAGDLVVYGSVAGIVPTDRFGAYGATKAATNFFMKVLMYEHRHTHIRFQLVMPPAVDTPLINQAKDQGPNFLRHIQKTRKNLISPEKVVTSVERCLRKGQRINYPGPAGYMSFMYRLFPKLVMRLASK